MAVTLDVAALSAALRLGDASEEVAEATRLLAFATEAVSRHLGGAYTTAPEVVVNEAAIRIAAYLYDMPNAGRGTGFANAMRSSGAAAMLLPYRVVRAGSTGTAEAAEAAPTPAVGEGLDAAAVRALIAQHAALPTVHHTAPGAVDLTAHAADPDAHHVPPTSTYVLPAAAAAKRGGVNAVTNSIIDANTSTGIFGWGLSHIRRIIGAVVPSWARAGSGGTFPASVVPDGVLTARMFGAGSVDHNALATNSVRRAAVLAEAIDAGKLDPAVTARLLAAATAADNGKVLTVVNGAWAAAVAASGGSARWREMAQVFSSASPGWTVDTALDAVLRPEGTAVFADAAALRAAIENHRITTFAMQRSDTEEVAIGINAANFRSSMNANYLVCFHFDGGQIVEVRFPTGGVTFTPKFMQPSGTVRLDLAVFG